MDKNTEQKVWETYESPETTLVTIVSRGVLCASSDPYSEKNGQWYND